MFQQIRQSKLANVSKSTRFAKNGGSGGDAAALFAEMMKTSEYARAVERDAIEYADVINSIIRQVANWKPSNLAELMEFVRDTDSILDELADETAVLKSFQWPKLYHTMRETKALVEELGCMKNDLASWQSNPQLSAALEMEQMNKCLVSSIVTVHEIEISMLIICSLSKLLKQ